MMPGSFPVNRRRGAAAAALVSLAILCALVSASNGRAPAERPLMRFPDISGNTIAFVYGEDIWSVDSDGGVATRLTIHDGQERYPRFSPDGSMIAFTGEYDGNADVYVMNAHGGAITRLTYHPDYDRVIGWHPTKNKIMFISGRKHFRFTKLYLVSPDGTGLEETILHNVAHASFSPDGSKIAYNEDEREFRTWKRYRGGLAQEVLLYDFSTNERRNLTNFDGTDRLPMWIGETVYFSSDRDGVLNIYSVDPRSGAIEQLTRHTEYDVRRPSEGDGRIVYELGGTLWVLDVATKQTRQVPVEIRADAPEVRPSFVDVAGFIQGVGISPSGARAIVVARGEVFTVPKEHGPIRNLTRDSGSRDKDAVWSPDGKSIAYLSDRSGEYEIYVVDAEGRGTPARLTTNRDGYRHTLRWSPDGAKIAFTDQTLTLYYVDVATKKVARVDKADYEHMDVSLDAKDIYDFTWSPDSRYLAYSKMNADLVTQVYIYSVGEKMARCVSDGLFNDFHPVFSRDGARLFFVSNRRFDPVFCDFEWEMVYKKSAGIYCLSLAKDAGPLLPPRSDEETVEKPAAEGAGKARASTGAGKSDGRVRIDFDGIAGRIEHLPLPPGNYRFLAAGEKALFYLNRGDGDFNRFEFRPPGTMNLCAFDFEEREEKTVIVEIDSYALSADGSSIAYRQGPAVGIISSDARETPGNPLDLGDLSMRLEPRAEWTQIFNEAWRMERDFYYEPGMHGLDWAAMREKYGRLMTHASCRQDVEFLVGELIGELNTSHTYVYGGDRRRAAERVDVGMLGADYEVDAASNRYRIARILRVPDWTREVLPPLVRPGLRVAEGNYILEVNGRDVTADTEIYAHFQGLSGKQVTLLLNDTPAAAGAWKIVVEPIGGENTLRYLDWCERNRRIVERESNGTIGYIHLPDTYTGSAREFPKYFLSQTRKEGIVVDGRFNGGGLDPYIFLQRLIRPITGYWTRRYSHDQTSPFFAVTAHLVCLTNRQAGSGGDELPFEFQLLGLGPVIGTRSWGGLVGVSMFIELVDGGGLTAPDYRIYDPNGKWVVENVGVTPDIEIDLHPADMARGHDAQLMKGIEELKKKIAEEPRPWPKHEPIPRDNKQ
jgi:tricorn protease